MNPVIDGQSLLKNNSPGNRPVDKSFCQNRPSIFFLGSKPHGARYFNGADVGVQLSIEAEAFGIVLLEAMSRGKPVLGSRIGGIPEGVVDGETGILVDPDDRDRVARAILDLAMTPENRTRMGETGLRRWRERFTVSRMQQDYVIFLANVG